MARKISSKRVSDFIRRKVVESKIVQFTLRKVIEARIRPLFNQIREDMLDELEGHDITKEIKIGPKLHYQSKFLHKYGDLFSFIGFDRDYDPIKPIREIFKGLRLYSVTSKGLDHIYEVRNFPTAQDIFNVTPMPWKSGASWAQGVEEGISGLGQYINTRTEYDPPKLRSTAGIQADTKKSFRPDFQTTPYITEIIKKYRSKFLEISSLKLLGIPKDL